MTTSANGKRRADAIDLTLSDDEQPRSKTPRTSQPTEGSFSQSQRDTWSDRNEEERAGELIDLSQDDTTQAIGENFEHYGTLDTKIVGVQYYRGQATRGEWVIIKREPSNPYDRNAIRIDNVRNVQIGHIPRKMAEKLARYIDPGEILVEGQLAGNIGDYDCPIALKLYGTSSEEEKAHLVQRMKADRLPLDGITQRAKEAKRRKAEELKRLKQAKKGGVLNTGSGQGWDLGSSQTEFAGSQTSGNGGPNIDDIVDEAQRFNPREMGEVCEKFGAGEDVLAAMPLVDQPAELKTEMLPYQRQALKWLLDQENPQLPATRSGDVVQLWKRSPQNQALFTNIATNFSTMETPVLASGGILADDMGLGKTLEMIALMVADKRKTKTPTLIMAPLGVMSNWSGQIAHHVKGENALKVLTYHGASKKPMKPQDFNEYDVVITTYGTLSTEYIPRGSTNNKPPPIPRKQGIFSIQWHRVILDEGHIIRNPNTKSALAASSLLADSRWVLTGTPIINNLKDLYSLVRFLKMTGGLERLDIFNSVLIRPLNQGQEDAILLLQALMSTICLRRRKEMKFVDLRLPEMNEYIQRIDFLDHEREKYEALQAEAQGLLRKYESSANNTTSNSHRTTTSNNNASRSQQETYRHLLEILLRLRQLCNHWHLCSSRVSSLLSRQLSSSPTVTLTPETRAALQSMLQLSIESHEDCPICLDPLHSPVITICAHSFGQSCIERVIETQGKCPMCRAELGDAAELVQPAIEGGESSSSSSSSSSTSSSSSSLSKNQEEEANGTSSKITALLSILQASLRKDPTTKTVIFSQWTSFLDIIARHLDTAGLSHTRIDGTMSASARDAAMQAFSLPSSSSSSSSSSTSSPSSPSILLASLSVCSVGLNLASANAVILSDSWWAPAIEDQAVDRVHRLGQTREVNVWRLVMGGSIEERVLDVQGEKRRLMGRAFGEREDGKRGGRGRGEGRVGDIRRLLGEG